MSKIENAEEIKVNVPSSKDSNKTVQQQQIFLINSLLGNAKECKGSPESLPPLSPQNSLLSDKSNVESTQPNANSAIFSQLFAQSNLFLPLVAQQQIQTVAALRLLQQQQQKQQQMNLLLNATKSTTKNNIKQPANPNHFLEPKECKTPNLLLKNFPKCSLNDLKAPLNEETTKTKNATSSLKFSNSTSNPWFNYLSQQQINGAINPILSGWDPSNSARFPWLYQYDNGLATGSSSGLFKNHQHINHHSTSLPHKRKGGQIRFSNEQTDELESTFDRKKYLSNNERKKLAKNLILSERQDGDEEEEMSGLNRHSSNSSEMSLSPHNSQSNLNGSSSSELSQNNFQNELTQISNGLFS